MVLKSIYDTVFIFPYTSEWLFLNTAWLDEAYLILPLPLLFLNEQEKYCFLRNYYFMSVSTNKMCGIVVSLFNALFNVTVHAYCAVCAWSLLSVVTETGPSGNITAQYNAISKYMPHTEWRCLLCVRHSLHAWCIWTMTTEIITIAINIS